jgi:hypothetical protein
MKGRELNRRWEQGTGADYTPLAGKIKGETARADGGTPEG